MLRIAAMAAALLFASAAAQAVVIDWRATMDQAQETAILVPVPGASGSATGSIDTVSGLLQWDIVFAGLSGAVTGIHFHAPAGPGVNAPIVVDIGAISGAASPNIGSATISSALVDDLLNRLVYINVHTAANPGGEIRGQVEPIPLPAALPLMLGAIAAAAYFGRKRRT